METTVTEIPINELADQIRSAHSLTEESARSSITHAFRAGELLTQAKERVPHGDWLSFIKEQCYVKLRSAQGYMRLYKAYGENAARVAHLSLRDALRLLSEKEPNSKRRSKGERSTPKSETHKSADDIALQFRREDAALALEVWTAGFRAVALKLHPDKGGDTEQMQVLNRLNTEIEKQLNDAVPHQAMAA